MECISTFLQFLFRLTLDRYTSSCI